MPPRWSGFGEAGAGNCPRAWLRFFDHSDEVRRLHGPIFNFSADRVVSVGGEDRWNLDMGAIRDAMKRRGKDRWTVCFADIEPDIGRFASRFEQHGDHWAAAVAYHF